MELRALQTSTAFVLWRRKLGPATALKLSSRVAFPQEERL
jgi:hypothetical protein